MKRDSNLISYAIDKKTVKKYFFAPGSSSEKEIYTKVSDFVAREAPLQIQIQIKSDENLKLLSSSITMRTPDSDEDLAIGYLFSEGIISHWSDILQIKPCGPAKSGYHNIILVQLKSKMGDRKSKFIRRQNIMASGCGLCGKESFESIFLPDWHEPEYVAQLEPGLVCSLFSKFSQTQKNFSQTGGLHASALFSGEGTLHELCEDVGRHNALDKLIGQCVRKSQMPLQTDILVLSGRVSFELLQKSVVAGIRNIVAFGAPSSLAIDLAQKWAINLYGFVKSDRFNSYN